VGWLDLSLTKARPRRWLICPRLSLFIGRSREERERVATAIRNWIEQTPAELRRSAVDSGTMPRV
jgi:hypothetical protein